MTKEEIQAKRKKLQTMMRNYAENIVWDTGGETVQAHNVEANALLLIGAEVTAFRRVLERTP